MNFAPFGLRPVGYANASDWNGQITRYSIDSAYATALYTGDPIQVAGSASAITGYATIAHAAATGQWTGVLKGVAYVDPTGLTRYVKSWTPGTLIQANSEIIADVIDDPSVIYEIQVAADGPVAGNIVADNIQLNANFGQVAQWAPNIQVGLSGAFLRTDTIAPTNTFPLKIIGLAFQLGANAGNAFGVNYNIVRVVPNNTIYRVGTTGV